MPIFSFLESYPLKDKYFVRTKPWDWLNKKEIYVVSVLNGSPAMITMDFWPQEIYLYADGQFTISALIQIASKQFINSNMPIPDNLDVSLIQELEKLVYELEIVEFRDQKTTLSMDLALSISKKKTIN